MLDRLDAILLLVRHLMAQPQRQVRDFGLTWQDPCSREAHIQMHRYILGEEPPLGMYDSDPPSMTRPPEGWVPPPIPPRF